MAHGKAGCLISEYIGGTPLTKVTDWEYSVEADTVDDTGGGDTWRGNLPTFKKINASGKYIRPATGEVVLGTLVGTEVAAILYEDGSVKGFECTILLTKFSKTANIDEAIKGSWEGVGTGAVPSTY